MGQRMMPRSAEVEERPVIGLITQVQETASEPDPLAPVTNQQYHRAIAAAGATPRRIPLLPDEAKVRAIYEQIDGLFLTGGADVDPAYYGAERHPCCEPADPARDRTELLLFRWAREEGTPIFGICRGMQMINVAAGGTLFQDLPSECPRCIKHDYFSTPGGYRRDLLVHEVRISPASRLGHILDLEQVPVN